MGEKFNFNTRVLIYPAIFVILFLSYMNNKVFFFNIISFSPNKTNDQNDNNVRCRQDCFYNNTELESVNNNHTMVLSGEQKYRIMNKGKYPQARRIEEGLARARATIRNAAKSRTYTSFKEGSFVPRGSVYHNPYAFHQSHIEMKKRFRVWAYKEGEPPIFHMGPMNDIYSTEGNFMNEFQNESSPFLARSMDEAQAFLIPVSVVSIIKYVYRPYVDYSRERLQNIVQDYIMFVSQKYPYWNRSSGADHFLVSCHDWAPEVSFAHPSLFSNFIRVLCNANSSEGFKPDRDVSLPEIKHEKGSSGLPDPNLALPPRDRKILAFFSGGPHGDVRPELFRHWKDKNDTEILVYEYLPETLSYKEMMGKSKFCLCPSGFEVASPRIVESIYGGCVPVIISPSYVLPFSDVLDWSKFSVQVPVEKIPELKSILSGISEAKYLEMQKRVVQVQRHFVINQPPEPFDFMHMVMHSLWLRRLNLGV